MSVIFKSLLLLLVIVPAKSFSDCLECQKGNEELNALNSEYATANSLLLANQNLLKSLSQADLSKKIKVSSNIFILSAKIETIENQKQLKAETLEKKGCSKCQKN